MVTLIHMKLLIINNLHLYYFLNYPFIGLWTTNVQNSYTIKYWYRTFRRWSKQIKLFKISMFTNVLSFSVNQQKLIVQNGFFCSSNQYTLRTCRWLNFFFQYICTTLFQFLWLGAEYIHACIPIHVHWHGSSFQIYILIDTGLRYNIYIVCLHL